jgi:hypothetical protein
MMIFILFFIKQGGQSLFAKVVITPGSRKCTTSFYADAVSVMWAAINRRGMWYVAFINEASQRKER